MVRISLLCLFTMLDTIYFDYEVNVMRKIYDKNICMRSANEFRCLCVRVHVTDMCSSADPKQHSTKSNHLSNFYSKAITMKLTVYFLHRPFRTNFCSNKRVFNCFFFFWFSTENKFIFFSLSPVDFSSGYFSLKKLRNWLIYDI